MNPIHKRVALTALVALLPAYFYANWQFRANEDTFNATFSREIELFESDRKFLAICAETGTGRPETFGSNDVLCQRAQERHKLQIAIFKQLEDDKQRNQRNVYWNFFTVWLLINAAVFSGTRWWRKQAND